MVKVMTCICGKNLIDGEDVKFHLTEKPTHFVDVEQWEYTKLPSFGGWEGPVKWMKVAEWTVRKRSQATTSDLT